MYIRVRVILIFVITNLVIISFGVFVGIINVRNDIERSQESDLVLVSEIADYFIGAEIEILKLQVGGIAHILFEAGNTEKWQEIFGELEKHHDFIGMAVLDPEKGLVASAGGVPAHLDVMDNLSVRKAFSGQRTISSTVPLPGYGVVFYVTASMPGPDNRILVATLDGMHFSQQLSKFPIWKTGHIVISDSEGYVIAAPQKIWESWKQERFNAIHEAKTDKTLTELAEIIKRMTNGQSGIGYFSVFGIPQVCAYRLISESTEGWSLGVIASLSESPFRAIGRGLVVVGLVNFLLGIVFAVIASHFIKKPFDEIAMLKEEAETNSRLKSNFIANMSHEIRTPMNTILGITEILTQDESLEENVSVGLDKIYSSGDMLLNIINDLLDLSKIEAGKMELICRKYELASLINDIITLNTMRFESKPVELQLFVDENLPAALLGDELRIKQVLNNLLTNAFKYTERGKIQVTFAAEEKSGDGKHDLVFVFSVSDTGQGMTEEQVAVLFDEYTRFNFGTNRYIEGTGLGMSITRNLLRLMDGEISIKSKLHEGSVFTVHIPQKRAGSGVLGNEMAEKLRNFKLDGIRQLRKTRMLYEPMPYGNVLIVDDVESNLYVAKGLMIPYKLTVDTALNGYHAVEKIKAGKIFDIIFMDHMMPKMSGIEATKIIRDLGYQQPIVALTANAVVGQMEVFLANGFDDFISKPIDVRYLNAVLKKYIRDKQPPEVIEAAYRQMGDSKVFTISESVQPSMSLQLAEFFIRDAKRAITVLEETVERETYDDEKIRIYTISAHAMKNALMNVGESELAAFAGKLEQAGLNNEVGFIAGTTPTFLTKLKRIVAKFTSLQNEEEGSGIRGVGNYVDLREKLHLVKDACEVYNKRAAKDAIGTLRRYAWSPAIKELLGIMSAHLLSGDYNEVSLISDKIDEVIKSEEEHCAR